MEAFTQGQGAKMVHVHQIVTLDALTDTMFWVNYISIKLENQTQERTKRTLFITAEQQSTPMSVNKVHPRSGIRHSQKKDAGFLRKLPWD